MDRKKIIEIVRLKNVMDAGFVVLVVVMGFFLHWKMAEIAVFSVFIWIIINPVPSRYPAAMVIFLLILTPAFLVFKNEIVANQLAIYAYYFLIMTVVMGIYEIKKENVSKELK